MTKHSYYVSGYIAELKFVHFYFILFFYEPGLRDTDTGDTAPNVIKQCKPDISFGIRYMVAPEFILCKIPEKYNNIVCKTILSCSS